MGSLKIGSITKSRFSYLLNCHFLFVAPSCLGCFLSFICRPMVPVQRVILVAEMFFELVTSVTREKLEPLASGFALRATTRQVAQGAKNAKFYLADAQIGERKEPISFRLRSASYDPTRQPDNSLRGHCRYLGTSCPAKCANCPVGRNPVRIARSDSEKVIFLGVLRVFAVRYPHGMDTTHYSTPRMHMASVMDRYYHISFSRSFFINHKKGLE